MGGWKGAFAYRWSRLERYDTAILKLNRGSALSAFLFRTAVKNGLDFHPMTVSRHTRYATLEPLLLRLPDALFDSAWLNTGDFQRERPPQPYFTEYVVRGLALETRTDSIAAGLVTSSLPQERRARHPMRLASTASSEAPTRTTSTTSGMFLSIRSCHMSVTCLVQVAAIRCH